MPGDDPNGEHGQPAVSFPTWKQQPQQQERMKAHHVVGHPVGTDCGWAHPLWPLGLAKNQVAVAATPSDAEQLVQTMEMVMSGVQENGDTCEDHADAAVAAVERTAVPPPHELDYAKIDRVVRVNAHVAADAAAEPVGEWRHALGNDDYRAVRDAVVVAALVGMTEQRSHELDFPTPDRAEQVSANAASVAAAIAAGCEVIGVRHD